MLHIVILFKNIAAITLYIRFPFDEFISSCVRSRLSRDICLGRYQIFVEEFHCEIQFVMFVFEVAKSI